LRKSLPPSVAVVLACLLSATASFAQGAPKGDTANGKKLFETVGCFECHGYAGQGGGAGPKLISPPPWEAFILQVRTPRQVMPPFTTKVLSDQQAADIYSYISTFPKPADPKSIPLLQN
jgi:mono/diheme cytochrome c family protein